MASSSGSRPRSTSNRQDTPHLVLAKGKDNAVEDRFGPCAASAAHFLYAQQSTVVVLDHDSLALQRKFIAHNDLLEIIAVDNVSERGTGRLVFTYDRSKRAMIWDLYNGKSVSTFSSNDGLTVASWMRNGNVAFGSEKGEITVFEPATSGHVSTATIFHSITALAPSADCTTYAIGYNNGTMILAALQPQFAVLHNISAIRSHSPIVHLCWHASSSKQKSDMLAIQDQDGDLKVWSVTKPPTAGPPRVIRLLKRLTPTQFVPGRTFVAWSKNGRVLQYQDAETWAWDVRTKEISYMPVPTVEYVRGIAAHGATAALFTLGPDDTVQQYDVESGRMIANVRHIPPTIPPTPPIEYTRQFNTTTDEESESNTSSQRYADGPRRTREPQRPYQGQKLSGESRRSAQQQPPADVVSPSQTEHTGTTFSAGVCYKPSQTQRVQSGDLANPVPSTAAGSKGLGSRQGSRLRQEIILSPLGSEDVSCADLFPITRARLSDVPYSQSRILDEKHTSSDDLRRQMLSVIFGWDHDITELIEDELARASPDSVNALLLTRWLGGGPDDMIEAMSDTNADSSLDWMRLGLGLLDNRAEAKQLAQIFVEKMLSKGEIHMAVVVLLATGDKNGAIEVYVTRNCYLEAILLTCRLMPMDWHRQSHLVRKWGEHVVENSQQQLAIRCFSCTGIEPSDPWTSPTAQLFHKVTSPIAQILQHTPTWDKPPSQPQAPFNSGQAILNRRNYPDALSLAAAPQSQKQASRMTPQNGGLRLITSFAASKNPHLFPGLQTDDHTPINNAAVTPIAESALTRSAVSPGGLGSYRLNITRSLDHAMTRDGRSRLASIGETPVDVEPQSAPFAARLRANAPPTPVDSGSDRAGKGGLKLDTSRPSSRSQRAVESASSLLTSARYDPHSTPVQNNIYSPEEPQTALRPSVQAFARQDSIEGRAENEDNQASTGHRGKKPDGLSLQMLPAHERAESRLSQKNGASISRPATTDTRATDRAGFEFTPPHTGDSMRVMSPLSVSGRSTDQYISSLETAQYHDRARSRNSNQQGKEGRVSSKSEMQRYDDDVRAMSASKRSPRSPVPMSPHDIRMLSTSSIDSAYNSTSTSQAESSSTRYRRRESTSTAGGGRRRDRSRSSAGGLRRKTSVSARNGTAGSIVGNDTSGRGRSTSRKEGTSARSPPSPLPMVPSEDDLQARSSIEPGSAFRFVSQDRSRLHRSVSRRPHERGSSARRDTSPDRRKNRSLSRQRDSSGVRSRGSSDVVKNAQSRAAAETSDDEINVRQTRTGALEKLDALAESLRQEHKTRTGADRKRELAQAELEARRLSLARRPSAPPIPLPGHVGHIKSASDGVSQRPLLHKHVSESVLRSTARSTNSYSRDRPDTPRAMERPQEHEQDHKPIRVAANHESQSSDDTTFLLPARTYTPMGSRVTNIAETDASVYISAQMPRHAAYDPQVAAPYASAVNGARAHSPDVRRSRAKEQPIEPLTADAPIVVGSPVGSEVENYRLSTMEAGPGIIPELQHLLVPPPPPPPPSLSPDRSRGLMIDTTHTNGTGNSNSNNNTPVPHTLHSSAIDSKADPSSHSPLHKRAKSGAADSVFTGKLRGITDRLRSASKTRDNARSPGPSSEDNWTVPYETHIGIGSPLPPPVAPTSTLEVVRENM